MIVVRIELHSAVTGRVKEIGRMYIGLDQVHQDGKRGDYDVKVLRRRDQLIGALPLLRDWNVAKVMRGGRVENYPRKSYNVWRLVARALKSAFPEEA